MKEFKKVQNKIKGDKGEIVAQNFLKDKKYQILEVNYKNHIGEIDIIAKQGKVIVFVEVKARSNTDFGRPIEAVNNFKQNKIRSVAGFYLQTKNQYYDDVRFDVIEVLNDEITHIENAF